MKSPILCSLAEAPSGWSDGYIHSSPSVNGLSRWAAWIEKQKRVCRRSRSTRVLMTLLLEFHRCTLLHQRNGHVWKVMRPRIRQHFPPVLPSTTLRISALINRDFSCPATLPNKWSSVRGSVAMFVFDMLSLKMCLHSEKRSSRSCHARVRTWLPRSPCSSSTL